MALEKGTMEYGFVLFCFFPKVHFFFERERGSTRVHKQTEGEGKRERERETLKQPPHRAER